MKCTGYAITFGKIGNIIGFIYALYSWLVWRIPIGDEQFIPFSENILNVFPIVLAGIGLIGYSLYKSYFFIFGISIFNALYLINHSIHLARMSTITVNDKIGYLVLQSSFDASPFIYITFIILSSIFLYYPKIK
ncbi:hypothetical protein CON72_21715 [Bacillus wiedmannii]|nr:hypothetical protein CON72_21715 [Bacillus wiedmannii]